jgi:hypothetical protein
MKMDLARSSETSINQSTGIKTSHFLTPNLRAHLSPNVTMKNAIYFLDGLLTCAQNKEIIAVNSTEVLVFVRET